MNPLWGQLEKAIDDDEKIEEAIARLIAEHDADPEAHLGEGGSLLSHKASEIIDHLARSIVFDKVSAGQLTYETNFENPSAFSVTGSPNFKFPGFELSPPSGGYATREQVHINGEEEGLLFNRGKDSIFQFNLVAEVTGDGIFRFLFGGAGVTSTEFDIGLTIDSDGARFFTARNLGQDISYLDWPDFEGGNLYIIRGEYFGLTKQLKVYINNEYLGLLDMPGTVQGDPFYTYFLGYNTTVGNVLAYVHHFTFQLSL